MADFCFAHLESLTPRPFTPMETELQPGRATSFAYSRQTVGNSPTAILAGTFARWPGPETENDWQWGATSTVGLGFSVRRTWPAPQCCPAKSPTCSISRSHATVVC